MKKRLGYRLLPALAALIFGLFCVALFYRDNKYTAALPGGYGRCQRGEETSDVRCLIDGREFYPGELLWPEDFAGGRQPETFVYIGQYANFSAFLGSPYGTATYRIVLEYDGPPVTLTLYLQELLSAGRVYINGELAGESGQLTPYSPRVADLLCPFTPGEQTEIIVQCANYSHYYSGLYYPPAVGTPVALYRMLATRFAVYGLLCFAAAALALSNLAHWLLGRDRVAQYMGILCLAFSVQMLYPFLRAWGVPLIRPLYALEDLCGNILLFCALVLVGKVSGGARQKFHRRVVLPCGAAICCASVVFPLLILPQVSFLTNPYGLILYACRLATGCYLVILGIRAARARGSQSTLLLCITCVYGLSAVLDVLTANRFEPIRGAWIEEYGSFVLVLGFAVLMVRRSMGMLQENDRLNRHLQQEVDKKTQSLERLLAERRELLANLVHDIKNPLAALRNYGELARRNAEALDPETAACLDALSERAGTVKERLDELQDFSRGERGRNKAELLELDEFLPAFYARNRPDMELTGATFRLRMHHRGLRIWAQPAQLCTALENLCYNALSFIAPEGCVTLTLDRDQAFALISVQDDGAGIPPENLPHIFERGFTSRADGSGDGLGLFLVRSMALEHGGTVTVDSRPGQGSTFTLRLPLAQESAPGE